MFLFLIFPFSIIYLLLSTLNWNEKKTLFLDSWFIFLAWLLSSLSVAFTYLLSDDYFRYTGGIIYHTCFVPLVIVLLIVTNSCAIAGVLYLRSRSKNTASITNSNTEEMQKPSIKKIWQTSSTISLLTLLMFTILLMAIKDINEKSHKDINEKLQENPKNRDGVSFGIYE